MKANDKTMPVMTSLASDRGQLLPPSDKSDPEGPTPFSRGRCARFTALSFEKDLSRTNGGTTRRPADKEQRPCWRREKAAVASAGQASGD